MSRQKIADLVPGTNYAVQVRAVRDGLVSEWSEVFEFTTDQNLVVPSAPSSVTWVVSDDAFVGTWSPVSSDINGFPVIITNYELEFTSGAVTKIISKTPLTGASLSYTLTFAENVALFGTPKAAVALRVRAVNNKGVKGAWSASIPATNPAPAAPTAPAVGSTATGGSGQIDLAWTPPADTDLTGYNVYVGATAGFTPAPANRIYSGNSTRFVYQTGTTTIQYFKIRAVDKFAQESVDLAASATAASPANVDVTAPAVPTGLAASIANNANGLDSYALVSWNAVAASDLAGYSLRYRKAGTSDNYTVNTVDKDTVSLRQELPAAYQNYEFAVRAFDWSANYSSWSGAVTATSPANTAPSNVTGLTSTAGNNSITYNWTQVADTDIKNYELTFSTSPTFASGNTTFLNGTSTNLTVGGLDPSTNYYARVRAVDTAGLTSAAWSSTDTKSTGAVVLSDALAPGVPTAPVLSASLGALFATWTPVTLNSGGAAQKDAVTYEVHIATSAGGTYTKVGETSGTFAMLEKDGAGAALAYGTTYYTKILAKDRDGSSALSPASNGVAPAKAASNDISATGRELGSTITTTSLTAPSSPLTGDIWNDTTSGFQKSWNGSTWVLTGLATIEYTKAKGTDLVVNGTGAMGTNYNFSSFTFDKTDVPTGAVGAFDTALGQTGAFYVDEVIPVDPSKKLKFSFQAKQKGTSVDGRAYAFVTAYDAYKQQIAPQHVMYQANTLTTLAVQLNPGDTTITLTSGANWYGSAGKPAGGSTHYRSIIWWDYVDPGGKAWEPLTYSRNWSGSSYWADGGIVGNVITLAAPYSGPVRTVGTQLSNGSSGGTFMYSSLANQAPGAGGITTEWTTFTSTIVGYSPPGQSPDMNTGWPIGTAYCKIGWLPNRSPGTPYVDAASRHSIAAVSLSDAAAAQQDVAGAIKTYITEYSVNASETVAPTTGWSTTTPVRTPGTFVWFRTTVTRADTTTSTTSPALLTGNTGATGAPGTPAAQVDLTATTQVLTSPAGGGATTPTTSVVTGVATNTTITQYDYSVDGAVFAGTVPAGVSRSGNVVTITGGTMTAKTITVRMRDAAGIGDTMTVAKVSDGATGGTGSPGTNGTDAYTVLLTNEAQVFPGSTSAATAGSATTSVIAYKGTVQQTATIGTITGQVTGLTTAITNNGTTTPTVTVTVTTGLVTQSGTLTIPVTTNGITFNKLFSWSVAYTGATGSTGSQGIQGPAGPNGATLYTWIKYADTPTTGMNDLPAGKTYMGIAYNKSSATESSVYSDYEWSLIQGPQGNQGIQGPAGADGQPTYTWIKYGDSAAGAGLSDSPTGKSYIGIAYNKTTATETNTPGDYEWSLIQGPQGPAGTPAAQVDLIATAQVLTSPSGGGATTPATSTVTGTGTNTTITQYDYSVDGAVFAGTVPAGVSRTGNVVTITGSTMTARTIAVRMRDAAGIGDTLTVAKAFDGATGSTGSTGGTGPAGADAYTVLLTNEAQAFAAGTTNANAATATSTVVAYKGNVQQTATVGTITGGATGITAAVTNNGTTAPLITFTVTTALTTANGTFNIPITVGGIVFNQVFSWSLAFTGAQGSTGSTGSAGANAEVINLTATSQILASPAGGGATTPATSVVSGSTINTTIGYWEYSTDGAAFTTTPPTGVSRSTNDVTITGSTFAGKTLTVRMSKSNGSAIADTLTVAKTSDGATGSTGSTGGTGPAGADAYTVLLDNEAQVFPGSTNAALAGSAATKVIAYKAAVQQAATIGTIPTLPTGMTAAITNNGTTTATVTFTVTTSLVTQSGTVLIPITVGGIAFTKAFAWNVAYAGSQGPTGPTGGTGSAGVSVTAIAPYFGQVTTGAAAPTKPANGTVTPSAPWVATEPTYVGGTELYRTEKISYSDGSIIYTTVSKVSSYDAAAAAMTAANGKNKVTHSTGTPGSTANTVGDIWIQVDDFTNNRIIAQWRGAGTTTWVSETIRSEFIAYLDAEKISANSTFTNALNVKSTFTLGDAVTPGIIKSYNYNQASKLGFSLGSNGLEIWNGKVSANTLEAGTTITQNLGVTGTLTISSTGSVQSSNYNGTTIGWKIDASGAAFLDANSTVKAEAIKAGVLGGSSGSGLIDIANGTSLRFNGGQMRSNTYNGSYVVTGGTAPGTYYAAVPPANGTTQNGGTVGSRQDANAGFYLGNDGLVIAQGIVKAEAFAGGTFNAGNIIMGAGGSITGGTWTLNSSGLTIPNGGINAASLNIQIGQNIMPAIYADFESNPAAYTGKFFIESGGAITSVNTTGGKFGPQKLGAVWGSNANPLRVYMGSSATDYNIAVEAGKTYIFSMYVWSGYAQNATLKVKWSNGTTTTLNSQTTSSTDNASAAIRLVGSATAPAGVTGAVLAYENTTINNAGGMSIDGIQVEEKFSNATTASTWAPPAFTSINGGQIRTGEMRSNVTATINGVTQPLWSINVDGYAQFTGAAIRGNTVVGSDATDADQSYIQSFNFVPGSRGWIIRADGTAEFRDITTGSITPGAIGAGSLVSEIAMTTGGAITAYSATNKYSITQSGISYADAVGVPLVNLPMDGSNALFTGDLVSNNAKFSNNFNLSGQDNILTAGSKFTLENALAGITPPANPTINYSWDFINSWWDSTTDLTGTPQGFHYNATDAKYTFIDNFFGPTLCQTNTDGSFFTTIDLKAMESTAGGYISQSTWSYGAVSDATNFYFLVKNGTAYQIVKKPKLNIATVASNAVLVATLNAAVGWRGIGMDASGNLYVVGRTSTAFIAYQKWTTAGVSSAMVTTTTGSPNSFNEFTIQVGDFDYGSEHVVIGCKSTGAHGSVTASNYVYVGSTGTSNDGNKIFPSPDSKFVGITWDGTNFRTLNGDGLIYKHTSAWSTAATVPSLQVRAAFTAATAYGGSYAFSATTATGALSTVKQMVRRAKVTVAIPGVIPTPFGGAGDPTVTQFYLTAGSSVYGTNAPTTAGATSQTFEVTPNTTGATLPTNTFSSAVFSPALIRSANGKLELNADGYALFGATQDASTAAGNKPALRVGDPAGQHLRIDGNEILAMSSNTTQATLILNQSGTTAIKDLQLSGDITDVGAITGTGTFSGSNIQGRNQAGTGTVAANVNSNGTMLRSGSARRLKKNIVEIDETILPKMMELKPVIFEWNPDAFDSEDVFPDYLKHPGFIADQAHEVGLDPWVSWTLDGQVETFDYPGFTAALLLLAQNQEKRIKALEARLED